MKNLYIVTFSFVGWLMLGASLVSLFLSLVWGFLFMYAIKLDIANISIVDHVKDTWDNISRY